MNNFVSILEKLKEIRDLMLEFASEEMIIKVNERINEESQNP